MVDLESEDDAYDVEPYVAVGDDGEPVTLGYYGAPGVPGFGLGAIYTDQQFSMVIADPDTDEAVACGDILRPDADEFGEAGLALVQLLPGRASSDGPGGRGHRADHPPARAGHHADPGADHPLHRARSACRPKRPAGYEGYVQGGQLRVAEPERSASSSRAEDDYDRRDAVSRPSRPRRATPSPSPTTDRPAHPASVWPRPTPTRTSRWSSRMRVGRAGRRAETSSSRTRRSSRRPGWRSCRSCRPVRPECRDSPSWTGWRCSASSTSRPRWSGSSCSPHPPTTDHRSSEEARAA